MAQPDFRGARGSNAGDDFHELWALSQSLALLDRRANLVGLTLEGLRPEDETGLPADVFDGVDCALYFGAAEVSAAERIAIVQFKYSAANPDSPWTVSRLTSSSAKTRDNSVLRRLGDAFKTLRAKRGDSPANISVRLISNQPVQPELSRLLSDIVGAGVLGADQKEAAAALQVSSGLPDDIFREFASAFDLSQTGSRFFIKESILRTISSWTEGDARALTDSLLRFVRQKMMPESKGEWMTRESILAELGFSDLRALFPCLSDLSPVRDIVSRQVASDVIADLSSGRTFICIHGVAGCGKTTALREVENGLPPGSVMVVFDCYGAGRYLDSDAYRHRPRDAFRQLSNELASSLGVPLLLTQNDVDYARAFHHRLVKAAEALLAFDAQARLVIAVDAADNSIAAARSLVPQERSFVSDLVNLGDIPANACILVTTRSGNLDQLSLPQRFKIVELPGFTRDETAQHVRDQWPAAPDDWIDDFHELSGGNPRVQAYALRWAGRETRRALDFLLPDGRGLSDVFRQQLEEAKTKAGASETLSRFCAGLTALPHPAPLAELSAITTIGELQLRDICTDLAPGVRLVESNVGFGDEDFEAFVRNEGQNNLSEMKGLVADRLMASRQSDSYAATHVAAALYAAGRRRDLIHLVQSEPDPGAAVSDPVVRREVKLQRLRMALQVCADLGDGASTLRTLLVGAEALHSREAIVDLIIRKFPDLAAIFMADSAARLVLSDAAQLEHHGPLLFQLFLERARAGDRVGARAEYDQLNAWLDKRRRELETRRRRTTDDWAINVIDVAAQVEAILLLRNPAEAINTLRRWRPRSFHLEVARIICHRLMASGKYDVLDACLDQALAGCGKSR